MQSARPWFGAVAVAAMMVGCGSPNANPGLEGDAESSSSATTTDDDDGGPETICTPGGLRSCYDGPEFTEGVGICRAGRQECIDDGTRWSECIDEVWPLERERCDTAEDDDCNGLAVCEPTSSWWQPFGSDPSHIVIDGEGHIIIAGTTGSFTFQGEDISDMYVLELDPDGTLLWVDSIVAGGAEEVNDLVVDDQGQVTMVGFYSGEPDFGGGALPGAIGNSAAFVVRYDTDGQHMWSVGEIDVDSYSAVTVGDDGLTYVAGRLHTFGDQFDEFEQLHVVAYDAQGQRAWTRVLYEITGLTDETVAIALQDADTLAIAAMVAPGQPVDDAEQDLVLPLTTFAPIALRFDVDSNFIDWVTIMDGFVQATEMELMPRSGGGLQVVANLVGGGPKISGQTVLLHNLGPDLQTLEQQFVGGPSFAVVMQPYPGDATLLALSFSGWLDLGPLSVGGANFGEITALTVVDALAEARWMELLDSLYFYQLFEGGAGPSGEVVVSGYADGPSSFLDETVQAAFIAKLVP
ncbi:MAG: hypothetical protein K0V04_33870 [Deltaproteobacteria bacterium]|nr:hypothetical protein [Deltaproteobacteria bacterium]